MSKIYVVLSDEEKEFVEKETEKWFEEIVGSWSEATDPSALYLFTTLFKDGTNIWLPNGVMVHTKMTVEKFKNYIGDAEYAFLKDTCIGEAKAIACAIATEIVVWEWIKIAMAVATGPVGKLVVWACGFAVDWAAAMMVYNTMSEVFKPKPPKEVKIDDEGIQEAC